MIPIPPENTPILPLKDPNGNWMMGTTQFGVIVQYIEPDKAVLIEWEDIAALGLTAPEPEAIAEPTKEK